MPLSEDILDGDALRRIVSITYDMLKSTGSEIPLLPPPTPSTGIAMSHTLPLPEPITSSLIAAGFDPAVAERFSKVYMQNAVLLRQKFEQYMGITIQRVSMNQSQLASANQNLVSRMQPTSLTLYTKVLNSWIRTIFSMARQRAPLPTPDKQRVREQKADKPSVKRPSFKQDAAHLLEAAFLENPYPGRDQKIALAENTGMEFKQVHVWFQNHRSRWRKDGKELKSNIDVTLFAPINSRIRETSSVREDTCTVLVHSDNSILEHDILEGPSPAHAYPSPYPPLCDYEPFPIKKGVMHFDTPWIRRSEPKCRNLYSDIDISEVTALLAQLHLGDGRMQPEVPVQNQAAVLSTLGFTTVLPRAPLPSLIKTAVLPSCAPTVITTTHVSSSSELTSRLSESDLLQVSSSPSTIPTSSRAHTLSYGRLGRKMSALPTRTPSPISERSLNIDIPCHFNTSLPNLSRSASVSSVSSVESFSSSSSSSSLDTSPSTPPSLPQYLSLPKSTTSTPVFAFDYDLDTGISLVGDSER